MTKEFTEDSFRKKMKGGLKKCELHKFGSMYTHLFDGWYQCDKCHAFHKPDNKILEEVDKNWRVKIQKVNIGIAYHFE